MDERLRDMSANGVLAALNFPTMPGFSGHYLARASDQGLAAAAITAYNDWHIDEWAGSHPGRFIPLAILPICDVDAMVAEVHRVAAKGCTAFALPETPYILDMPSFRTDYWDPVFRAACDEDMTICMHIGLSIKMVPNPDGADPSRTIIMGGQMSAVTTNDLFTNGVFKRFPRLKVALSEGGIGWISFYLDRADRHVDQHQWTSIDISGQNLTPTEVFRNNILGCFITDPTALRVRDRIGIDSIAWECDFPHSDSTWPESPELLWAEFQAANCSDAEINKITWQNACKFFRYDPFKYTDRKASTVAALRESAADVDTSTTSRAVYRARYQERLATAT
jgi:predicted TIM-barrel fold metal-dependent hydrolase